MAYLIKTRWQYLFDEIVFIFANTGQEMNETLDFVQRCDEYMGLNVVWVEAEVHPGKGNGTTAKVVDYESASRQGEPFEAMIQKYGVPNFANVHCTKELKLRPMRAYFRDYLGWEASSYYTAIGIRADEQRRRDNEARRLGLVYPLLDWAPTTKPEVNTFWENMPFRLQLKGYQGNCAWCYKKSFRKLFALMDENPRLFDFPERMEELYSTDNERMRRNPTEKPVYFFKGGTSTKRLRQLYEEAKEQGVLENPENDAAVYVDELPVHLQLDNDEGGCAEHCEVDFSSDDDDDGED
jgi:hypothetical protein